MHGPLPSTSELALLLPSWPTGTVNARWNPTDSEWGKKNVPWFWSEDDFAQQTRALVRANTPAREMIAWLVHGVRWDSGQRHPGGVALDDLVHRWSSHGGYLRAWTKEVGDTVPAEALEAYCRQLVWHPAWRNQDLSRVLDDFGWAHELRANIARRASMRKPLSSLGALELGHCTNNFDAMYESAQRMCASLGAGPSQSEAMDVLESKRLGLLSPSFVRGILVATLLRDDSCVLQAEQASRVWELWRNQPNPVELDWWKVKIRSMMLRDSVSAHFLQLGMHPFFLIHEDKRRELELLTDLQPQALRVGMVLSNLLKTHDPTALPLPDLGMAP